MKSFAVLSLALIGSSVTAFVSSSVKGRPSVALNERLADRIFGMDLFAPNPDVNSYGARKKKNLKVGELKDNSYIPAGLTKAEYDKIRKTEFKKKQENYERNVKKAFQYTDFTKWYEKRGTELSQSWLSKRNTLGHNMAKTKFDWSGVKDTKKFESTNTEKFVQGVFGKKVAAKKKTVPKKKLLTF